MRTITPVFLLLLASCSPPATKEPVAAKQEKVENGFRFSGEVRHGQDFEREFGNGLLFRLRAENDPMTPGWYIEIRTADKNPELELSEAVTIPLRGFNPKYVSVSYGNTAAQVVAMKERGFRFLKNPADLPTEGALRRILLWPPSKEEWKKALEASGKSPQCDGSFRILDYRLATPEGEAQERIEWLKFAVELCSTSPRP
jgi:hypothetical protein